MNAIPKNSHQRFQRALVKRLALVALPFAVASCRGKSTPPEAHASAAASSSAVRPAALAKPAGEDSGPKGFAELVAASKPLAPVPETMTVGGFELSAEVCKMDGPALLARDTMSVASSLAVAKDHIYLADAQGKLLRYAIEAGSPCRLTQDKSFGKDGVLGLKETVRRLSVDRAGKVVASNGIFGTFVIEGRELRYDCGRRAGYVEIHPEGDWGIGTFSNNDVNKVLFGKDTCSLSPWLFSNLGQKQQKGPFRSIHNVGYAGDETLVGGELSAKVAERHPVVVVALNKQGKETFRFGDEKNLDADSFRWVHDIQVCTAGICVLDSSLRRLSLWKRSGEFVGIADLAKLLGLKKPWAGRLQVAGNAAYLAAGQLRGHGVAEGLVYRLRGL